MLSQARRIPIISECKIIFWLFCRITITWSNGKAGPYLLHIVSLKTALLIIVLNRSAVQQFIPCPPKTPSR